MAFEQLFQLIKGAIEQLNKIQSDMDPLLRQLETVGEIFKKYSPVSNDGSPEPESGASAAVRATDANILWQTIEPVIYLHDKVSKYLQEGQEDDEESTQDYSHGQLGEYTNELVFKYLAVMIESSVRELRNAVKAARDKVDEEAAKSDSAEVYQLGSSASDPSHSDLSKDHFSNVLNQPAGLVATVTTNWTTQQVVKCWDDPNLDEKRCIDEILSILHHPAFPKNKTIIQQYMFDTVELWWNANPTEEKERLRSRLTRDSVQQRDHEDNTLTLKNFDGKQKGPANFPGSWPEIRQPPKKASILRAWANDAIADFNWAIGIVQRGRRDPMAAVKEVGRASGSLIMNYFLVFAAIFYHVVHGIFWLISRILWPFGIIER